MGPVAGIIKSSVLAGWLVAQIGGSGADWDALVQRGVELRLAGDEAQALAIFHEAARSAKTPRLLAQMALAEQSLGYWRDAEAHLLEALAMSEDAWIVKQRAALDTALGILQRHLGSLELLGGVGGELFIDGKPEGELPRDRPLRLEVGRHRVEVRREGYFSFSRDVEITSETTARETVELSPMASSGSSKQHVARAPQSSQLPLVQGPSQTGVQRVMGWTFVGAGTMAGAVGVASLLASNERARDYNADPACTGRVSEPTSCASAAGASRQWRVASIASFALGAVLVSAGVVLLLWRSSATPVRVQVAPARRGAYLNVSGAF